MATSKDIWKFCVGTYTFFYNGLFKILLDACMYIICSVELKEIKDRESWAGLNAPVFT